MANESSLQVGLELVARRSWSYVLSGTKRVLVNEVRLTNKGSDIILGKSESVDVLGGTLHNELE